MFFAVLLGACQVGGALTHEQPDLIKVGEDASIPITLYSNQQKTDFRINGVQLPRGKIETVLVPRSALTITAKPPCYTEKEEYLQPGNFQANSQISFVFMLQDKVSPDCSDSGTAVALNPPSVPPRFGGKRLAWVITAARYAAWPNLPFVQQDRASMAALLRNNGFEVMETTDGPLAALQSDLQRFSARLRAGTWDMAMVYVSSHGISVNNENYLVPTDAPPIERLDTGALFPVRALYDETSDVRGRVPYRVVLLDACRDLGAKNGTVEFEVAPGLDDAPGGRSGPLAAPRREGRAMAHLGFAEPPRIGSGSLVNFAAGLGRSSYGDGEMSAWTRRFVETAQAAPSNRIDDILSAANQRLREQTRGTVREQIPVLFRGGDATVPAFAGGP